MRPIPHRSDGAEDAETEDAAAAEESVTEAAAMTGEERWLEIQEF